MPSRLSPSALWMSATSTYWFVPSIVTVAAMGLALLTTAADRHVVEAAAFPAWFYGGGADGARALLSAVAGSMITVVSVTFSVTIVALTVSSQHFGPRLLSNFMRDTGAQLVLGGFIGTFAYCLLVLRTVQGEGEGYQRFVPHLSVTVAVILTLVSVAALIYYVHHVASSMQVSQITLAVVHDLEKAIDRLYPEQLGREAPLTDPITDPPASAIDVPFAKSGYVQHLETGRLLQLAAEADIVIWLRVQPGDFATEGLPLAAVHPPPADVEAFRARLDGCVSLGPDRTSGQDAGFPIQQLVEVALHALSSGINEPFTAITCLDRLGQGLARLATRHIPGEARTDSGGRLRVVAPRQSFGQFLDGAFFPIQAHLATAPDVGVHMLRVLARLAAVARRQEDRDAIARHARETRAQLGGAFEAGPYAAEAGRALRELETRLGPSAR